MLHIQNTKKTNFLKHGHLACKRCYNPQINPIVSSVPRIILLKIQQDWSTRRSTETIVSTDGRQQDPLHYTTTMFFSGRVKIHLSIEMARLQRCSNGLNVTRTRSESASFQSCFIMS